MLKVKEFKMAKIKKATFRGEKFVLKMDDMKKEWVFYDKDFVSYLLDCMECKTPEELVGKEVNYYAMKQGKSISIAIENPDKGVVYGKITK